VTPSSLLAQIEAGTAPVILDVRSRQEFKDGHVPGARHLPFWSVPWRWREIPAVTHAPIVVYCGHGPRAHIAGALLRRFGFDRITFLDGHMTRWVRERLPVELG
jgi:rhodanese-related sulfurtransferase